LSSTLVHLGEGLGEEKRTQQRAEEWLLVEWPDGHKAPMKYWLSTLGEDVPLQRMVFEAKMRWRIERDYQDLKQDLGLGDYEGRGWRGFHHHKPRGSPAHAAPRPIIDNEFATAYRRGLAQDPASLPLLPAGQR